MPNNSQLVAGEIVVNSEAYENLTILCDTYGSRFYATPEEKKSAEFISTKFIEYGLKNVKVEPSTLFGWKNKKLTNLWSWNRGTTSFELVEPVHKKLSCISMAFSPSTPDEGVTAEIFNLENGSRDYILRHKKEIRGKIVLMGNYFEPGVYEDPRFLPHGRTTIYGYLVRFGAKGMLWLNSDYGGLPKTGAIRFGFIGEIPACGISRETSDFIIRQMKKGLVRVNLKIKNRYAPNATTYNVIGEILGTIYPNKAILVGGHFDGHDNAPGAMDDAAGACVVIEAARAIAKYGGLLKRTIRFCCFSGEETGLIGSTGYVLNHREEMNDIELMINTDAAGISSKTGHGFEACGSKELASYLERISNEIGSFDRKRELPKVKEYLSPYSNHWPFYMRGVPTAHFRDVPSDPIDMLYSHTSEDTVDKVDPKGLKDSALILALALMKIADSEEIPVKHTSIKDIIKALEKKDIAKNLRVEGRWLREISPNEV